jgi:hypothetical protein
MLRIDTASHRKLVLFEHFDYVVTSTLWSSSTGSLRANIKSKHQMPKRPPHLMTWTNRPTAFTFQWNIHARSRNSFVTYPCPRLSFFLFEHKKKGRKEKSPHSTPTNGSSAIEWKIWWMVGGFTSNLQGCEIIRMRSWEVNRGTNT